jgi:hypothetical protein
MIKLLIVGLLLLNVGPDARASVPETPVAIKLGPVLEIGREGLLFGSVSSVCEDDQGDIYVVDQREQRVLKFAPDGRLLLTFGRRGQGPGDFRSPGQIAFTSEGELAVLEDVNYVSFHRTDGTFSRRLDLNGRLGLGYVGPACFHVWDWRPDDQQQLLVDADNEVIRTGPTIDRDLFSALLPDETGRMVMFNYSRDTTVPRFLHAYGSGLSAMGISDGYEIELLDERGKTTAVIRRDVAARRFNSRERQALERELSEFARSKRWPDGVVRELRKKIPAEINRIKAVCVAPDAVLVVRHLSDITAEAPLFPVDIFTRSGDFLGTGELPEVPLFVSGRAMYFSRDDADGNVFLVRRSYSF